VLAPGTCADGPVDPDEHAMTATPTTMKATIARRSAQLLVMPE
jgi:hypothetical protein